MIRFAARCGLLVGVLVLTIGTIRFGLPRALPPNEYLRMIDPHGCPMPCWLGIRPGVTTMTEAIDLLHDNPYIDAKSIQPFNSGSELVSLIARWRTPIDPPFSPDPNDVGTRTVILQNTPGYDVVKIIILHVNIPLGEFVQQFGPPDRSAVAREPIGTLFYVLEYPQMGMQFSAFLPCRKGLSIANVVGTNLLLQPLDQFQSQIGDTINLGWSGFSSTPFDERATRPGCY